MIAIAADTEALFRLQLQELEQGRSACEDLDFAYRFQLSEALEASRALAPGPYQGQEKLPGSAAEVGSETEKETDEYLTLHRDLLETQARQRSFLGVSTPYALRILKLSLPTHRPES